MSDQQVWLVRQTLLLYWEPAEPRSDLRKIIKENGQGPQL